jgi:hypothetical protein
MKTGDLIKIKGHIYDEDGDAIWCDGIAVIMDAHRSVPDDGTCYYEVSYNGFHGFASPYAFEVINESG